MWRKIKRTRRRLRPLVVAFAGLLVSIAMFSGLAHANARYFYCDAMGLLGSDPCAVAGRSDDEPQAPSAEAREGHADCCEVLILPSLPQGTHVQASAVPPAPLLALLSAASVFGVHIAGPPVRRTRASEHWRHPPRSAAQVRAQLMVFLT